MSQGRGGNISIVARGKYFSRKFSLIEISVTMYESSNLECFLFLHCLHFAVVNSDYSFVILFIREEETLPILLFYGYFTRIVFLDQLLFDFDDFAGIDCLHDPL